jgi:hypothetical protein
MLRFSGIRVLVRLSVDEDILNETRKYPHSKEESSIAAADDKRSGGDNVCFALAIFSVRTERENPRTRSEGCYLEEDLLSAP